MERIEQTILRNLLFNRNYYSKVVPFIKPEYFEEHCEKVIYEEIWDFASKYQAQPTPEVLDINLQTRKDLSEDIYQKAIQTIKELGEVEVEYQWLLDTTEKWCKDRAIYLALLESIKIADGCDPKYLTRSLGSIFRRTCRT